jgi:hypothetical protein
MKQTKQDKVKEVSPVEDLMREHGVLDRILLIYDEILWRQCITIYWGCRPLPMRIICTFGGLSTTETALTVHLVFAEGGLSNELLHNINHEM